jgi:hypothetical protein
MFDHRCLYHKQTGSWSFQFLESLLVTARRVWRGQAAYALQNEAYPQWLVVAK